MNKKSLSPRRLFPFVLQMVLIVSLTTGLILAVCAAIGWGNAPGYALGLLIGGGIVSLVGAVLASEPLIGRASRGRRGLEETDEARAKERSKDRPVDRTVFDLMGTGGVIIMGLGVAVYLLFG
jgi:hypothetical protein